MITEHDLFLRVQELERELDGLKTVCLAQKDEIQALTLSNKDLRIHLLTAKAMCESLMDKWKPAQTQ